MAGVTVSLPGWDHGVGLVGAGTREAPMGRSKPTVRSYIEQLRERMEPYRRPLRMQDHDSYDRLWEHAAYDAPSIKMADNGDVDWLILFAIARGQQREIEDLKERLAAVESV